MVTVPGRRNASILLGVLKTADTINANTSKRRGRSSDETLKLSLPWVANSIPKKIISKPTNKTRRAILERSKVPANKVEKKEGNNRIKAIKIPRIKLLSTLDMN